MPGMIGALSTASQSYWLTLGPLVAVFLFALAVLWFLLPFAVFGIKKRLDAQLRELQGINASLRALSATLHKPGDAGKQAAD